MGAGLVVARARPPPAAPAELVAEAPRQPLEASTPPMLLAPIEDEALAKLLGERSQPSEFVATVLKAKLILMRRLEAKRVAGRAKYARSGSLAAASRPRAGSLVASALARAPREHEIASGVKLLAQRLAFLGLAETEIAGDGNCQFRALSYQLFGTQEHHAHVRERACAHILAHPDEYSFFFEPHEFVPWVVSMQEPRRWGDELTLRAAADAFCITIHVIQSTPENWHLIYSPAGDESVRRAVVTYVAPIHYNCVCRAFDADAAAAEPASAATGNVADASAAVVPRAARQSHGQVGRDAAREPAIAASASAVASAMRAVPAL